MSKIAATRIQICIFWHSDLNYNQIDTWPADVKTVWNAMGGAIVALRKKHGQSLPVEMYICPINADDNATIVAREGLDFSLLPAVQVFATYPDGKSGRYFLSKSLAERFSGINWQAADVQPYITALLYNTKPVPESLLCRLVPPLCSVGGWVWFALAAGATLRAAGSKDFGRAAWGTASFLLWKEWYDRGGVDQIKALLSAETGK